MQVGWIWVKQGLAKEGPAFVGAKGCRDIAGLGVGREEIDVAVAARAQQHGMARVPLKLAADQVAGHDAARLPVGDHEVEHLAAGKHLHLAGGHLAHQGAVGAEQQLLAGLAAGIEGARQLGAAEGAVGQQPTVLAREGDPLGHALVDDGVAHLGQAVDVGLAGAKVPALDGVVEQAPDAVAVVGVVLGRVDAALGGDAVRPARGILDAERLDVVAQLRQAGRGRGAGQPGAHDNDVIFALVRGVDQLRFEAVEVPFLGQRACRNLGIKVHGGSFLSRAVG